MTASTQWGTVDAVGQGGTGGPWLPHPCEGSSSYLFWALHLTPPMGTCDWPCCPVPTNAPTQTGLASMTPSFSERQASRAPSDQPCSHRALIQEDPGDATASTQREDSREPVGISMQWDVSFQPETRMCSFILFSEPRCPFCVTTRKLVNTAWGVWAFQSRTLGEPRAQPGAGGAAPQAACRGCSPT